MLIRGAVNAKRAEIWSGVGTKRAGSTEPWTVALLCALLGATGGKDVLEAGCSIGYTAKALCRTLGLMGGGHYVGFDPSDQLLMEARVELSRAELTNVTWTLERGRSPGLLKEQGDETFDFIWLDNVHEGTHIRAEFQECRRILRPGGIVACHDVFGKPPMAGIFPMELELPLRVPTGGIGLWQKPTA